ncbi:A24 family peptidase [Sphingomonas sp.]|uniref:A24 family peptidase n=1 Tax=Sphingomonas sp. TaxID=28214 RepID=UPI002C54C019|nr:prepilin peptidase [Sphingomonas sp.]HTG38687.1 prepilin peptidase [Sphingomonas sp.]
MGVNFAIMLPLALACLLVSAGIEDVRRREIANWKNAAIAALAPLWWWATDMAPWPDMAFQLALGAGAFALFAAAFAIGMMGGGDVKMIAALALWVPVGALASMLIAMSLIGGAITLAMMIERKWRRTPEPPEIPYGVAIACAAMLTFSEPLLNHFR